LEASVRATGAQHLVQTLLAQGVTHAFCVPGESYLAVLDALYDVRDRITVITCRHEAAAANMAEAHGKLTGRPGICFVTRGPGATQASIGVHTAFQDSTPMILFIGQVARGDRDREAFQEVNYRAMFGPLAKWVSEIDQAERVPEYVARAVSLSMSGRPGPVVLSLPEDMLDDEAEAAPIPYVARVMTAPDAELIEQLSDLLAEAERPFLLLGGPGWTRQAVQDVATFARASDLPVGTSFRAKDLIDNLSPHYVGDVGIGPNPKLALRVRDADLIIAMGARLGEMTTGGYTLFQPPVATQKLVHIHCNADELNSVFHAELAICASMPQAAAALADIKVDSIRWADQRAAARADYETWIAPLADSITDGDAPVNLSHIFAHLNSELADDAIICNGAGNYAGWLHRFYQHAHSKDGTWKTQLAPTSGAMGYGVPAAIAAKIIYPNRTVIAVAGDGCFLMSAQELATAVRYDARVIFIVVNNSQYGTIRMHQEKHFPGRQSSTALTNPNFAAFAESFGVAGFRVHATDDFPDALQAALACNRPALIEIITDPEEIAPGRRL
jgi:acetolactate synthase I/II/III large subunit